MSLLTDRDEFNVGSALFGVACAVLATATATGWGIPVSAVLIVVMAARGWWQTMPNWVLLAASSIPVIATEAADTGNNGYFVVIVALLIAAANGLSRPDAVLVVAVVVSPVSMWAAGVEDYVELGPWTWTAGLLLGWLFGAVVHRLWGLIDELNATRQQLADAAADRERQRIAREMHDVVGHSFSVVLLHLAGARTVLESDPTGGADARAKAEEALRRAESVGRRGMEDLRQTIGLMRSGGDGARPVPGSEDLEALIEEYRAAGLAIAAELDGAIDDVVGASRLVAHDVVRESLTNCAKHAEAGTVDVVVSVSTDSIDVRIESACDASGVPGDGTGIDGMRQRVEALGGRLTAGPSGSTWIVRARIPRELDRPDDARLGASSAEVVAT